MISIIMPSLSPDFGKISFALSAILKNSGKYEVILVLQKTSVKVAGEIQKYFEASNKLKIINDTGIGISRARNIAIKASIGDWILLLDDDVYIKNNVISMLDRHLSDNDMFYYGNAMILNTSLHYVNYYMINDNLSFWSYNRVCSISLVINRKVFNKIGYFDENLGSGTRFGSSEESDLVVRALLKGINIKYLKSYCVYHEKANHSMQKVERYAMGGGALCKKHLGSGSLRLYVKFLLDLVIRVIFLLTFQRKRLIFLKGFFKGFAEYKYQKQD